ncbi:hypothetical protein [Oceanivirga miroungae]|uniref:ATPase n=1 Tax=Oceanivirga miroungae TaxID=1130046 RepID=A0A6I8M9K5_9FUSO|nr:hypothetical protein [Oceanivirga miroungae]VWL85497.1 ATPase [Oceanivirga miroungae]
MLSSTILLYSDKRVDLKSYAYNRARKIFSDNNIEYVESDVRYYDNIKIKDTREIIEKSVESSYKGIKIFILDFDNIRVEASNSLLKAIEEPVNGTFFILISTNKDKILPTILSRCIKEYIKPEVIDVSDKIYSILDGDYGYIKRFTDENINLDDYKVSNLEEAYQNIENYFKSSEKNIYQFVSYNLSIIYLVQEGKFSKLDDKILFISNIQNLLSQDKDNLLLFFNRILVLIAFKVDKKVYEILVNLKNSIKNNVNKKILIYLFLSIVQEEV